MMTNYFLSIRVASIEDRDGAYAATKPSSTYFDQRHMYLVFLSVLYAQNVSVRRNTPTKAHHHRSCYELYRTRSMKYVKETRGLGEVIKGV